MKKTLLLTAASLAFAVAAVRAQAPARFNYQGIARSATGTALASQSLGLRISILDGSSTGAAVYSETQTTTTNAFGLYTLAIGGGTPVTGTLAGVAWGVGDKYIRVEIDPAGGTNYVAAGTTQLLSVPYAMSAAGGPSLSVSGQTLSISGGNSVTLPGSAQTISGTANYLPKFTTSAGAPLTNSALYEAAGRLSIGTTTPMAKVDVITTDTMALHLASSSATSNGGGILQVEYTGTSVTGGFGIYGEYIVGTGTASVGTAIIGVGGNTGLRGRGLNSAAADAFGNYSDAFSQGNTIGVVGAVNSYTGVAAGIKYGLLGNASGGATNYGVYGVIPTGTTGTSYAGYFAGNVQVIGSLAKSAGTFKIDHPQDPENKYLYHSFVESPDMMNVYNGNTTTDASGYATVTLPGYFEALNKDFRYQLTVMGQTFAQAIVSQKVQGNHFEIRTNQPNVEVSWQVTGIRNDAYAQAHRVQPEVDKETENKGKYLNPVELGREAALQIGGLPSSLQAPAARTPLRPAGGR